MLGKQAIHVLRCAWSSVTPCAVQEAPGILNDDGGYAVYYSNSHVVCDYAIAASCIPRLGADSCLAQVGGGGGRLVQ